MKKPWRTCREVASLISARQDRAPLIKLRVGVRLHVFICMRCTRRECRLGLMRQGMCAWKNYKAW